jgi:hypothetical protein
MSSSPKYKVGDTLSNNQGLYFKILEYHRWDNIIVQFLQSGEIRVTNSSNITCGAVRAYSIPSAHGIGYISKGDTVGCREVYTCWADMLRRVAGKARYGQDLSVSEEWKVFSNFKEWYFKNRKVPDISYELDKDLKIIGNTHYSSENCTLVPKSLNASYTSTLRKLSYHRRKDGVYVVRSGGLRFRHINYEDAVGMAIDSKSERLRAALSESLPVIEEGNADFLEKNLVKGFVKHMQENWLNISKSQPSPQEEAIGAYRVNVMKRDDQDEEFDLDF